MGDYTNLSVKLDLEPRSSILENGIGIPGGRRSRRRLRTGIPTRRDRPAARTSPVPIIEITQDVLDELLPAAAVAAAAAAAAAVAATASLPDLPGLGRAGVGATGRPSGPAPRLAASTPTSRRCSLWGVMAR